MRSERALVGSFRLTTPNVMLFTGASLYAMKVRIVHAIDRDPDYRLLAVAPFIESHDLIALNDFCKTFAAP
jgi:hypothetical protein